MTFILIPSGYGSIWRGMNDEIVYEDDHKGKSQSWTATIERDGRDADSCWDFNMTGYGQTKEEAHKRLFEAIKAAQVEIKTLFRTIDL